MSNNAPHDPNQHNPDLLDMEDGLEARHATVAWCLQHLTLAHDNLPALAVNDQIKNRMARSMAALTGEEARLRGQLMRVRMPDE